MPPKAKISKENIINSAIKLIQAKGIESLNARALASDLNCSTQPILYLFDSMNQIKEETYKVVDDMHTNIILNGLNNKKYPTIGMGMAYIEFAKTEKNLFKFLFMSDYFKSNQIFDLVDSEEGYNYISILSKKTGLNLESTKQLFVSQWLTIHGIASIVATNSNNYSEEEIEHLLLNTFNGVKNELLKNQ